MKLLILTQKVAKNDPVLGFFHQWIIEFANRFEAVTVVCLEEHEHALPHNVRVRSLGKESGASRSKYMWRFFRYIVQERSAYDVVFVHMNQEYVLLGGIFWKLFGKQIFLWRNHPLGTPLTRVAVWLADTVLYTSPLSYTAAWNKSVQMPAGIDTTGCAQVDDVRRETDSILSLGRISPIKNIEVIIEALGLLSSRNISYTAALYGNADESHPNYYTKMQHRIQELQTKSDIVQRSAVPHSQTPDIYQQYDIFINATKSGSMDKTILEAMLCGCIVVVSNLSFKNILPSELLFKEGDREDLANTLARVLSFSAEKKDAIRNQLRAYVLREQSLDALMQKLTHLIHEKRS